AGLQGPRGLTGSATGVAYAVHGDIGLFNQVASGTGFQLVSIEPSVVSISFVAASTVTPHCIVSPNLGGIHAGCTWTVEPGLVGFGSPPNSFLLNVTCTETQLGTFADGGYTQHGGYADFEGQGEVVDLFEIVEPLPVPFSFICVQDAAPSSGDTGQS